MKAFTPLILIVASLTAPIVAQDIPANAHKVHRGKGWACNEGYVERGDNCIILALATDAEIRRYLIRRSIASYPGNCPCPYNVDRAGRRCGRRSAYSRPGGYSPLCYPRDISDEQVKRTREKYPSPRKK